MIILQIYFPGIIDIRLQKRAFHSRFDRFIKQFKVCQNQLNGCMSPQVQRREKGKNPFCGAESKTSILQLKGSIRIVISPADIQKSLALMIISREQSKQYNSFSVLNQIRPSLSSSRLLMELETRLSSTV